jgi:hypothetical protein
VYFDSAILIDMEAEGGTPRNKLETGSFGLPDSDVKAQLL